jgi:hypothetical protein
MFQGMLEGFPVAEVDAVIRRTLRAAAALAVLAVGAGIGFGHPLFGPGVFVGLGLAVFNNRMFQLSAVRFTTEEGKVVRKPFASSVAVRLGLCTAVAMVLVWLVPSLGWGVIGGLAAYQLLLLVNSLSRLLAYQRAFQRGEEAPGA